MRHRRLSETGKSRGSEHEIDLWSGREDLNLRLHRPERCALPGCATPRPAIARRWEPECTKRPGAGPTSGPGGSPTLRQQMPRLDHNERLIIGLTLALKLGVLLLGLGAWQLVHGSGTPPFPGLELWDRWDAPHYTDLIVYGYTAPPIRATWSTLRLPAGLPGRPGAVHRLLPALPVARVDRQRADPPAGVERLHRGRRRLTVRRAADVPAGAPRRDAGRGPALRLVPADLPDRLFPAHRLHRGALHGAGAGLVPGGADRALVAGGVDRRPGGADPDQRPGAAAGPAGRGRHPVVHDPAARTALAVGVAGDRAGRDRLRRLPRAQPGDLRHAIPVPDRAARPLVQVAGGALGRHQRGARLVRERQAGRGPDVRR